MRTCRRCLIVVGLLISFAAVDSAAKSPTVTLLHFNDVYEIDAVEGGHAGGLARVATVVARLKKSSKPLIVTLGGDFLSPSALGTARIDGEPLAGRQMVAILNALPVDWAVFGNHEFDVSEAAFHTRLKEARFHLVASNVTDVSGKLFEDTVSSAIVPMRAGRRNLAIGLIGLTIDSNRRAWVQYGAPIEAARREIEKLRGRVSAIVALTHLSLAQDRDLVTAIPDIDLVLGGHEHENWMIRRGPHFTPIVKADANVRTVAVVTLTFPKQGARPTVAAQLEEIDERVPANAAIDAEVKRWTAAAFDAFRRDGFTPETVVGTIAEALDGRESTVRNQPGPLTDLILAAMEREAESPEVTLLNGGSIRIDDTIPAGPIREYDIIRILPFGGKILKAGLDGALLASVLDAGLKNKGSGGYLQARGVERDGAIWKNAGRPLDPAARYQVAFPEFLLTGLETNLDFLSRSNPQVHDVREFRDVRRAVIDELKRRQR